MSKTIRRKKGPVPDWVTHEYKTTKIRLKKYGYVYYSEWLPLPEEEQKKQIAKYHSDSGAYMGRYWPVPKWYKRNREKYCRAKNRAELQRINSWKAYDEYVFNDKRFDYDYYW